MAFFAEDSKPAFSNRLALFHNLPTDAGVEQTEWIDVRPVGSTSHGGVIEFNLSAAITCYLDLLRTRLFLRARIRHDDGMVLKPKEKSRFCEFSITKFMEPSRHICTTASHFAHCFYQLCLQSVF